MGWGDGAGWWPPCCVDVGAPGTRRPSLNDKRAPTRRLVPPAFPRLSDGPIDGHRRRVPGTHWRRRHCLGAPQRDALRSPPPPPIQIVAPIRAASKSVSCPLKVTGLSIHNPRSGLFPIVDCHKALIKVTKTTQCTNPPSRMRFRTNPIICQKSVRVISFSLPISVIH